MFHKTFHYLCYYRHFKNDAFTFCYNIITICYKTTLYYLKKRRYLNYQLTRVNNMGKSIALTYAQVTAINDNVKIYGYTKTKAIIVESELFNDDETAAISNWLDYQKAVYVNGGK